jgi:sugar phosphate isomerase/epimerase
LTAAGGSCCEPEPDELENAWDLLPKNRIGHVHCRDTVVRPDGKYEWTAVGKGVIDWTGQFKAFKKMGYHLGVSLETHWHGGGTPEESSRQSWAGMKAALQSARTLALPKPAGIKPIYYRGYRNACLD